MQTTNLLQKAVGVEWAEMQRDERLRTPEDEIKKRARISDHRDNDDDEVTPAKKKVKARRLAEWYVKVVAQADASQVLMVKFKEIVPERYKKTVKEITKDHFDRSLWEAKISTMFPVDKDEGHLQWDGSVVDTD